jgi:hypothetical protein
MDEDRLAAVFRAAAADPGAPPAPFDHGDVVRASRRVTLRRRSALAGGALAVVAVLGVGVVAALPPSMDGEPVPSAAAEAARSAPGSAGSEAADAAAPPLAASPEPLLPAAPLGPGDPDACADRQDPAVRALLEEVLPEVAGAPEAVVTLECRPGGERGVNLEVDGGVLTVQYLPPGGAPAAVGAGAVSATRPTASGGTVTVAVRAMKPGGPVPFADRVDAVAAHLAPRL